MFSYVKAHFHFTFFSSFLCLAPALPDSCLPLGMKPQDNKTKLVPVPPSKLSFRMVYVTKINSS